jgi:hypothetical protein
MANNEVKPLLIRRSKMANTMDLLGQAAKKNKKAKKKKDEKPIIVLEPSQDNVKLVKEWLDQKKAEKTATTNKKKAEERLKPQIAEARKDYCLSHKYHSAVQVKVGSSEPITASFQKKCTKISTDDQERLQE